MTRVQIGTGHGPWLFSIKSAEVDSHETPFFLNKESISWLFHSDDASAPLLDPNWETNQPLYPLWLLLSLEVIGSFTLSQTPGERQDRPGQGEVWGPNLHLLCTQLSIPPAHCPFCPVDAIREENRSNEGKTHSNLLYSPKFKTKQSILKRPVC